MNFNSNTHLEKTGTIVGYLFSYFLFTTMLFYIFIFLKKIPETWTYFHMMKLTAVIAVIGMLIRRILK